MSAHLQRVFSAAVSRADSAAHADRAALAAFSTHNHSYGSRSSSDTSYLLLSSIWIWRTSTSVPAMWSCTDHRMLSAQRSKRLSPPLGGGSPLLQRSPSPWPPNWPSWPLTARLCPSRAQDSPEARSDVAVSPSMTTLVAYTTTMCTESMSLAMSSLTKGEIDPADAERVAVYQYNVRMGGAPSSME